MADEKVKKILVVDDDEAILEAFDFALTDEGYEIKTSVKDGDHVMRLTSHFKPDLLILDLLLSGADGRDICKKLKSLRETKHIPIIMVSAHPDARESALEAGANDFLAKPFEIDELLKKITDNLGL